MTDAMMKTVACVGTGVIGRGWIYNFVRAGCHTRAYDKDSSQIDQAITWLKGTLKQDIADGFLTEEKGEAMARLVTLHTNLREALDGVEYVQESGPEVMDIKNAMFAEMDRWTDPKTILASSASSLNINEFTAGIPGMDRCILAHPFNPPHIIPAVEVMPTKKTDPNVVDRTIAFLKSLGHKPMLINFFVSGYLINRIQAAVVREAIHLVESGLCNAEAVDTAIKDGLGLRWVILGNFGTNHTNAVGGIREYYGKFGKVYQSMMKALDSTPPSFDDEMVERFGKQLDEIYGRVPVDQISKWRDRLIRKIRRLKDEDPNP